MSEHTKGKWEYSTLKNTQIPATLFVNHNGDEIDIAVFEKWEQDWAKKEMEANARLIAAAPALLEACELTYERICENGNWDDGRCFYYCHTSASELEEPLSLLKVAIKLAKP